MNIEDDIENEMSRILREEIDKEILLELRCKMLVDDGWTMVSIDVPDHDDIGPWIQANIRGDWRGYSGRWLFESADDATLFRMRWL